MEIRNGGCHGDDKRKREGNNKKIRERLDWVDRSEMRGEKGEERCRKKEREREAVVNNDRSTWDTKVRRLGMMNGSEGRLRGLGVREGEREKRKRERRRKRGRKKGHKGATEDWLLCLSIREGRDSTGTVDDRLRDWERHETESEREKRKKKEKEKEKERKVSPLEKCDKHNKKDSREIEWTWREADVE